MPDKPLDWSLWAGTAGGRGGMVGWRMLQSDAGESKRVFWEDLPGSVQERLRLAPCWWDEGAGGGLLVPIRAPLHHLTAMTVSGLVPACTYCSNPGPGAPNWGDPSRQPSLASLSPCCCGSLPGLSGEIRGVSTLLSPKSVS